MFNVDFDSAVEIAQTICVGDWTITIAHPEVWRKDGDYVEISNEG